MNSINCSKGPFNDFYKVIPMFILHEARCEAGYGDGPDESPMASVRYYTEIIKIGDDDLENWDGKCQGLPFALAAFLLVSSANAAIQERTGVNRPLEEVMDDIVVMLEEHNADMLTSLLRLPYDAGLTPEQVADEDECIADFLALGAEMFLVAKEQERAWSN